MKDKISSQVMPHHLSFKHFMMSPLEESVKGGYGQKQSESVSVTNM